MALEIYKKGQGFYTRSGTALGTGVMAALGCWSLYQKLEGITGMNPEVRILVQAGVPLVLFLVLSWLIYRILNKHEVADFMIATEGEMKKVSWSTRKEIMTSTKVVIYTVLSLALMLFAVDFCFRLAFEEMGFFAP